MCFRRRAKLGAHREVRSGDADDDIGTAMAHAGLGHKEESSRSTTRLLRCVAPQFFPLRSVGPRMATKLNLTMHLPLLISVIKRACFVWTSISLHQTVVRTCCNWRQGGLPHTASGGVAEFAVAPTQQWSKIQRHQSKQQHSANNNHSRAETISPASGNCITRSFVREIFTTT
ncbi:Hypothetical protein, putative [Bodo saltans]|uniref:Uncharacterized protein n=1 Tax=Bodo saltans TaxID=75058 RepID=A0A0S4J4N3_BODSA|nr:Hypothetical protein, putative [Bodo saltans]|eukprot:CUG19900.1 Hypothetical protein, putative [Bodo saltans]